MADAEYPEAERFHQLFATLDHRERIGSHRSAPRNPGAETRLRGRIGGSQSELAGKRADFRLGEAGIAQGCDDFKLGRRDASRAIVAHVVEVLAIRDGTVATLCREVVETLKKLGFAEIAAVRRIRGIVGIIQLQRLHHLHGRAKCARHSKRFGECSAWKARAVGDDAEHFVAECAIRFREQKRAVHSPAVCDDERCVFPQQPGKAGTFRGELAHSRLRRNTSSMGSWSPM